MKRALFFVIFYVAGILCGCSPSAAQDAALATPSPTLRVVETATLHPKLVATPANTKPVISPLPSKTEAVRTPVRTPTLTPNRKALTDPSAQPQSLVGLDPIQIRSPGDGSIVVSPIPVEIQLISGKEGRFLRIELHGEDGTLLMRKLIDLQLPEISGSRLVDAMIDFEIPGSSQNGLLIVQIDQGANFPLAINSTNLVLLASGESRIPVPAWQPQAIDIQQPAPGGEGNDGMITVSGFVQLDSDQPLKVQLISLEGKVVGQRLAGVGGSPGDSYKSFTAQVPYRVDQRTQSRVVVYCDDGPNGEITHLASVPIVLNP